MTVFHTLQHTFKTITAAVEFILVVVKLPHVIKQSVTVVWNVEVWKKERRKLSSKITERSESRRHYCWTTAAQQLRNTVRTHAYTV